jgi:hypothetical protein
MTRRGQPIHEGHGPPARAAWWTPSRGSLPPRIPSLVCHDAAPPRRQPARRGDPGAAAARPLTLPVLGWRSRLRVGVGVRPRRPCWFLWPARVIGWRCQWQPRSGRACPGAGQPSGRRWPRAESARFSHAVGFGPTAPLRWPDDPIVGRRLARPHGAAGDDPAGSSSRAGPRLSFSGTVTATRMAAALVRDPN